MVPFDATFMRKKLQRTACLADVSYAHSSSLRGDEAVRRVAMLGRDRSALLSGSRYPNIEPLCVT